MKTTVPQACKNVEMTEPTITDLMNTMGAKAKAASANMARAQAATKSKALLTLGVLLRQNLAPLAMANSQDLARAASTGLAGPMLDRLKLTPKDIETVALGCEQLAAMPDVIGEIIGMKQQPSGIRSQYCPRFVSFL